MASLQRPHGFGICIPPQSVWADGAWIAEQELELLRPPWYMAWGPDALVADQRDAVFCPMIYRDLDARHASRLAEEPGETWLFFNEPERPEQSGLTPEQARIATRVILRELQDVNVEFQTAFGGFAADMSDAPGTAWGANYFQLLRRREAIRGGNYVHVHGYRSSSVAQFWRSWDKFRAWYAVWGGGAPVILSEVCAENAPYSVQVDVMMAVQGMLNSGEIAAAAWFSAHVSSVSSGWPNAALCNVDVANQRVSLTPLGQFYVGLV